MARREGENNGWYVYVILCDNRNLFSGITINIERRLKEQFSNGTRTSKFLLENKPLIPIKKFKCKSKDAAKNACHRINHLKGEEKEDFIITSLLKRPKPLRLIELPGSHFELHCPECGFKSDLKCDRSTLEIELLKFKCIHETIREKIDSLFEQAILGAGCFHNGRFMFQGKNADRARDFLLGFSELGHRKRTMSAYESLDEISFKNSYLLLSTILEESYYIIQEYAGQYSQYKLKGDYRNFSFKKDSNVILKEASNIRFCKFAQLTRLVANVLKHTGGIIKTHGSGKMLIDEFKLKEEWDVVALRNFIQIGKTPLGNVFFIITRLYVFIIDLIAFIFNFKKFRVKSTEHHVIAEEIVNYDVRDSYKKYLKNVQQDGTVLFVDL